MKIKQILYTNTAAGLTMRCDDRYLPLTHLVPIGGQSVTASFLWASLENKGKFTYYDLSGKEKITCFLQKDTGSANKRAYTLYREGKEIAQLSSNQYARPRVIQKYSVSGLISIKALVTPQTLKESAEYGTSLADAASFALSLGLLHLLYAGKVPEKEENETLQAQLRQSQAYAKALEENYDDYVKTLEQALLEWETRYPEAAQEEKKLPGKVDYLSQLKKALEGLHFCIAGGNAAWHEKMSAHFPACTILKSRGFDSQKLQDTDLLIINSNHTSHALVRKACQIAASQGIMVCYTSHYNLNTVAADILYALGV